MKHGAGTFSKLNGSYFQGTWVRNKKLEFGKGRLVSKQKLESSELHDGPEYSGNLKGSQPHGRGVKIEADGTVYAGSFKNGNYHGTGTLSMKQRRDPHHSTFLGNFRKGDAVGTGVVIKADDGVAVGKGMWLNNSFGTQN